MHKQRITDLDSVNVWLPIIGDGSHADPYRPKVPRSVPVAIHGGIATHTWPHPRAGRPVWPWCIGTIPFVLLHLCYAVVDPGQIPPPCKIAYAQRRLELFSRDPTPVPRGYTGIRVQPVRRKP